MSRFDEFTRGKNEEFLMSNGLIPMDEAEMQDETRCMDESISLSTLWKDKNNDEKYIKWDSELESYLQHLARMIDYGGRESFEPYTIYQSMGLSFLDGFALNQSNLGCIPATTNILTSEGLLPIGSIVGRVDLKFPSFDTEKESMALRDGLIYDCGAVEC